MVTAAPTAGRPGSPRDLPEDLALPLRSGAAWWYWLGGRPATDLVNTLRERWRRRVETLVDPADLGAWLHAAGLTARDAQPPTRALLADALELREHVDAAIAATVEGAAVPQGAVAGIDRWLSWAGPRPHLVLGDDGRPDLRTRAADASARRALAEIALDAARMLGDPAERTRVRICAAPDCSARFYDRSPAGRRRWCSMRTCGNRDKVRRHRERAERT